MRAAEATTTERFLPAMENGIMEVDCKGQVVVD
jgi:hypothetical protein